MRCFGTVRAGAGLRLGAGLALTASVLAGCGRPSAEEEALGKARRAMLAMHAGSAPAPAQARRAVHQDVLKTLQNIPERLQGSGAQASAWMLISQAQSGLALIDAQTAMDLDRRALNLITEARAMAELFASHSAFAAAIEAKDFGPDIAGLTKTMTEIDQQAGEAIAAKLASEKKVADLTAAANAKLAQARSEREKEQKAKAEAQSAPASTRSALFDRAFAMGRVADGLEREAADIQAQANLIRPQVGVAELDIERAERQKQLLALSRKDIEGRAAQAKEQAAQVRAEAAKAAADFAARLKAIEELRAGDQAKAYDAAIAGLNQAQQSMKKAAAAAGEGKTPMAVAVGSDAQTLGDVQASRARATAALRDLVLWASTLKPALPESAGLAALAASLGEARSAASASAGTQYDAARSAYAGSGARGETADRLKAVGAMLPGAPPPEPPPAPAEPAPADSTGQPVPDGATPAQPASGSPPDAEAPAPKH